MFFILKIQLNSFSVLICLILLLKLNSIKFINVILSNHSPRKLSYSELEKQCEKKVITQFLTYNSFWIDDDYIFSSLAEVFNRNKG